MRRSSRNLPDPQQSHIAFDAGRLTAGPARSSARVGASAPAGGQRPPSGRAASGSGSRHSRAGASSTVRVVDEDDGGEVKDHSSASDDDGDGDGSGDSRAGASTGGSDSKEAGDASSVEDGDGGDEDDDSGGGEGSGGGDSAEDPHDSAGPTDDEEPGAPADDSDDPEEGSVGDGDVGDSMEADDDGDEEEEDGNLSEDDGGGDLQPLASVAHTGQHQTYRTSFDEVLPEDVGVPSRTTRTLTEEGVNRFIVKFRQSNYDFGVGAIKVCLTKLPEKGASGKSSETTKRFTLIDGAHRLAAVKRLTEEDPESFPPSRKLGVQVYRRADGKPLTKADMLGLGLRANSVHLTHNPTTQSQHIHWIVNFIVSTEEQLDEGIFLRLKTVNITMMAKKVMDNDIRPTGAGGKEIGIESIKRLIKLGLYAMDAPRSVEFIKQCMASTEGLEAAKKNKGQALSIEGLVTRALIEPDGVPTPLLDRVGLLMLQIAWDYTGTRTADGKAVRLKGGLDKSLFTCLLLFIQRMMSAAKVGIRRAKAAVYKAGVAVGTPAAIRAAGADRRLGAAVLEAHSDTLALLEQRRPRQNQTVGQELHALFMTYVAPLVKDRSTSLGLRDPFSKKHLKTWELKLSHFVTPPQTPPPKVPRGPSAGKGKGKEAVSKKSGSAAAGVPDFLISPRRRGSSAGASGSGKGKDKSKDQSMGKRKGKGGDDATLKRTSKSHGGSGSKKGTKMGSGKAKGKGGRREKPKGNKSASASSNDESGASAGDNNDPAASTANAPGGSGAPTSTDAAKGDRAGGPDDPAGAAALGTDQEKRSSPGDALHSAQSKGSAPADDGDVDALRGGRPSGHGSKRGRSLEADGDDEAKKAAEGDDVSADATDADRPLKKRRVRRGNDDGRSAVMDWGVIPGSSDDDADDNSGTLVDDAEEARRLAWLAVHPLRREQMDDDPPAVMSSLVSSAQANRSALGEDTQLPAFAYLLPSEHQARDFVAPEQWQDAANLVQRYLAAYGGTGLVTSAVQPGWADSNERVVMSDTDGDAPRAPPLLAPTSGVLHLIQGLVDPKLADAIASSEGSRAAATVLHERGWVVLPNALRPVVTSEAVHKVLSHFVGLYPGDDAVAKAYKDGADPDAVWTSIINRDNLAVDAKELFKGQGRMMVMLQALTSSESKAEQDVYQAKLHMDMMLAAFAHAIISRVGGRVDCLGRLCVRTPKSGSRMLLTSSKALPQRPHVDADPTANPLEPPLPTAEADKNNKGKDAEDDINASAAAATAAPARSIGAAADLEGDLGPDLLPPLTQPIQPAAAGPETAKGAASKTLPPSTPGSNKLGDKTPPVHDVLPSTNYFVMASGADGFWLRTWPGSVQVLRHVTAKSSKRRVVRPELVYVPPYSMAIFRGDLVHAGASAADNSDRMALTMATDADEHGAPKDGGNGMSYSHCIRLHMYIQDVNIPIDNAIHVASPAVFMNA